MKEVKPYGGINIMTFKELYDANIPDIEHIVDKIIPKSSLVYIFGPAGSFKTNFLLYTVLRGINGENVFEFNVLKPFTTLWIDEENRDIGMKDKLRRLCKGLNIDPNHLTKNNFMISNNVNILNPQCMKNIEDIINDKKPNMVVIDSIAKVFPLSERDETDVKKIFTILKPLIVKYGITIVFIHHARKMGHGQKGYSMEDIAGTREFAAQCDSLICIEPISKTLNKLSQYKNRYRDKIEPIVFSVDGDNDKLIPTYEGTSEESYAEHMNEKKEAIITYILGRQEDVSTKDICTFMKVKEHTAEVTTKKYLKTMIDEKDLIQPTRGFYVVPD